MPITISLYPDNVGTNKDPVVSIGDPPGTLYLKTRKGCEDPYEGDERKPEAAQPSLLSSSFQNAETPPPAQIIPYGNGFVNGVLRAFNQDLHLVIRPDDVWLAILVQFNYYVNGNAEMLREMFVTHEGKKTLTVDIAPGNPSFGTMGAVAQSMASKIEGEIVDKGLRDWMLPNFSTTTDHDRSVASFVMMGSLKAYFEYAVMWGCGFPSVTLLGERSDWIELQKRVERLPKYGEEAAEWAKLLRPVMRWFILTLDHPTASKVTGFWLRVAWEAGSDGSGHGVRTLSGWLTAFAFWDEKGQRVHNYTDEEVRARDGVDRGLPAVERKRLILDEVTYPYISPSSIPKGVMTVPVMIRDYSIGMDRFTTVLAGSVGMALSENETKVQPVSAWWLVEEFQKPIDDMGSYGAIGSSTVGGSTTDGACSETDWDDNIT